MLIRGVHIDGIGYPTSEGDIDFFDCILIVPAQCKSLERLAKEKEDPRMPVESKMATKPLNNVDFGFSDILGA